MRIRDYAICGCMYAIRVGGHAIRVCVRMHAKRGGVLLSPDSSPKSTGALSLRPDEFHGLLGGDCDGRTFRTRCR